MVLHTPTDIFLPSLGSTLSLTVFYMINGIQWHRLYSLDKECHTLQLFWWLNESDKIPIYSKCMVF